MIPCAILGTGIDLVENRRIRQVLERWGSSFKNRVFLPAEQAYCDAMAFPYQHYAARFAAKEAVAKALGTGIGLHVGWLDLEVVRDAETGAPSIRLHGRGCAWSQRQKRFRIVVSLSHTSDYAVASALIVAESDDGHSVPYPHARGGA